MRQVNRPKKISRTILKLCMKKVIFYIDYEWALGTIHAELTKQLFARGINSYILPWDKNYTREELLEMNDACDLIMTTPHGYIRMREATGYQIPQNRFAVVAHATVELVDWKNYHMRNYQKKRPHGFLMKNLKAKAGRTYYMIILKTLCPTGKAKVLKN